MITPLIPGLELSEKMSEVASAPEEPLLLYSGLPISVPVGITLWKKQRGPFLIGAKWTVEVGGCFGFASTWPPPHLVSVLRWPKHWAGWQPCYGLLAKKPGSNLKLLEGSFQISGSPEVNGSTCFLLPFWFHFLFSFSFRLKRCKLSEPQCPHLSNRNHDT